MPGPKLPAGADRARRTAAEGARPGHRYRSHLHPPGKHSRHLLRRQRGRTDWQAVAPGALRLAGGTAQYDYSDLEGAHRAVLRPGGAARAPAENDGALALGAPNHRRTETRPRYSARP